MLLLRLVTGVALAWNHGFAKLQDPSGVIKNARGMGFPAPEVFGWAAALSEGVFALLLAIGLLTRPSALMVAITMGTAAFLHHAEDDFATRERAMIFMAAAIFFLLAGPGRFSLDRFIAKGGTKRAAKSEDK